MLITSTSNIEGYAITQYLNMVFGESIVGINAFKDIAATFRNIVGGRVNSYENELINARGQAFEEMAQRAAMIGADAIVGVDLEYETLGAEGGMIMVTVSGTAVRVEPRVY